jgi:hypothetical protein
MKSRAFCAVAATIGAGLAGPVAAESTISLADRYAYGANTGWIDCRADGSNGVVIGATVCSGAAYGANVGWIGFGSGAPTNGLRYGNGSATDYGVNHDGVGNLRGFAWGGNIGWLYFESQGAPRVDLMTGNLSGYVWGANVGWIGLSNLQARVRTARMERGPDSDGNGIPDAWEIEKTGALGRLSTAGDADGDGMSDRDEYWADTDPLDPESCLRVEACAVSDVGSMRVTWQSHATRLYRIETADSLALGASWSDCGLGLQSADGASTVREVAADQAPAGFLRIKAVMPLGQ